MSFKTLAIIIGLATTLVSFVFGWFKNRSNFCTVEKDRKGNFFKKVLRVTSWMTLYNIILGYGDDLLALLTDFDAEFKHGHLFVSWLFLGIIIELFLALVYRIGYKIGGKVTVTKTSNRRQNCAKDLSCVLKCPRACEGCPLIKQGVLELQEVTVMGNPNPKSGDSPNPENDAYIYCGITNLRNNKTGYAVKQLAKDGHYYFVPMPNRPVEKNTEPAKAD
ncbi:MAG: hypothetical protein Q4B65_01630 [Candidatus Saccharibacteria bacterium]|nr:hypothetical protein [Candidatus Saccharibacteria bacterium]